MPLQALLVRLWESTDLGAGQSGPLHSPKRQVRQCSWASKLFCDFL